MLSISVWNTNLKTVVPRLTSPRIYVEKKNNVLNVTSENSDLTTNFPLRPHLSPVTDGIDIM